MNSGELYEKKCRIPGQALLLQLWDVSSIDPSALQIFPPFCGKGLSHFLFFIRVPPPQVTEQDSQDPQKPQEPSTLLPFIVIVPHSSHDPQFLLTIIFFRIVLDGTVYEVLHAVKIHLRAQILQFFSQKIQIFGVKKWLKA